MHVWYGGYERGSTVKFASVEEISRILLRLAWTIVRRCCLMTIAMFHLLWLKMKYAFFCYLTTIFSGFLFNGTKLHGRNQTVIVKTQSTTRRTQTVLVAKHEYRTLDFRQWHVYGFDIYFLFIDLLQYYRTFQKENLNGKKSQENVSQYDSGIQFSQPRSAIIKLQYMFLYLNQFSIWKTLARQARLNCFFF